MIYRTWKHNLWFLEDFYAKNLYRVSLEKNDLYLAFNSIRPPFFNIYCYNNYTAKHAGDNTIYLK